MTKAGFQIPGVECYDMYFTGVNGARVYVRHQGLIEALLEQLTLVE